MITDTLLKHPWMSPMTLGILVVLGPLVGAWLVSRPKIAWVLTGVSMLLVAALALVPVHRELFARCVVEWSLPTPGRVELFANVVLFVPPVLLAGVATRRPVPALVAGSGLSVALETVQAMAPAIGRSCDTTDWLSNTIGAVIGAALAAAAISLRQSCSGPHRVAVHHPDVR